jgi:outer membrane protein assembly factor BamA
MSFVPRGFPPIEGALFADAGIAWRDGVDLVWRRQPGDNPYSVREPVSSVGAGARMNLFGFMILRLDMAIPLRRPDVGTYWTLSLGPAF